MEKVRLGKYIAQLGITSRRKVPALLASGKITVNGKVITDLSYLISPEADVVRYNNALVTKQPYIYYALNKPKGIVSTTQDDQDRKTVVSLIPTKARIYPIGRLDKDTTGLLLLTNDGELVNKLIHPKFHIPKTYEVIVQGQISEQKLEKFRNGLQLEDGLTAKAQVKVLKSELNTTILEVVLFEGKKRQIRRMFEKLGNPVVKLNRTRFGPINLGTLKPGNYRLLTKSEVIKLKKTT